MNVRTNLSYLKEASLNLVKLNDAFLANVNRSSKVTV